MAETVLAVIPLVVSAIEHYTDTATAVSRFRRYASEAADVASVINIQRRLFRNANRKLLGYCVCQQDVDDMVEDDKHPKWQDDGLERAVETVLGDSSHALLEIIRMTKHELAVIEQQCSKLQVDSVSLLYHVIALALTVFRR